MEWVLRRQVRGGPGDARRPWRDPTIPTGLVRSAISRDRLTAIGFDTTSFPMRTDSRNLSARLQGESLPKPGRLHDVDASPRPQNPSIETRASGARGDSDRRRGMIESLRGVGASGFSTDGASPIGRVSARGGEAHPLPAEAVHGSMNAMTTMQWLKARATPRENLKTGRARSRRPALLLILAALSLCETGCQSGFFGPCGTCRTGLRRFGERVFRPFRRTTVVTQPCCGGEVPLGVESVGPLQYGPPSVVVPAPAPAPLSTVPSTTIPNGTISTPASPSIEPLPSTLEPIPSAKPGPPPAADGADLSPREGARTQTGKANYEAYRPPLPDQPVRSSRLDSSRTTSPESTERSAQGSARTGNAEESNPLDNLPPLDIPKELSRADSSKKSEARTPTAVPGPAPTTDVGLTDFSGLRLPVASLTVAPGIRRFAGVESKLAGGSLPNADGLDWLAEKGYKTILDLREENEISPTFISDVSRRGMRYVALPITLATMDQERLKRFQFEIGLADSRPLYFFDTDGNRAGMLWYVQRITADGVDDQVAQRDAEELGLTDSRFLNAARAFLDAGKPAPAPAPAQSPGVTQPPANPPAPEPAADPVSRVDLSIVARALPTEHASNPPRAGWDASSWRALIPIFVTILGLPAAYVSRSLLPDRRVARAARASLEATARPRRSLPSSSGA